MKLVPKDNDDIEMDMSPMIDMVFLLLIFFIVASQIIDEKPPIDLPFAAYAKVPEDIDLQGRLMISVNQDEDIWLGQKKTTIDELALQMAIEMEQNPELEIVIRAGKEVKYKTNEQIMTVCGQANANELIFAALEE